jgi:DNA repair protein RecO (recombination protein O)
MGAVERVSLEPAWVLHRYPYRDSSLLVEVFTHAYGRVGLVARGARSPKSRRHGELQLLRPLLLSWTLRGELGTLTGAEARAMPVAGDGRKVLCVSYLNELLLRLLTRHDPHPALFTAYEQAIEGLGEVEELALRYFEKHLLQELGYGLLLDREFDSGAVIDPSALYEYRLEQGPVRCRQQGGEGIYLQGASLLALSNESLDGRRVCREVRRLTRAALSLYLGARPLKTRAVLNQLASMISLRPPPDDATGNRTGVETGG